MRCMVDFQTNLHLSGFRSFIFFLLNLPRRIGQVFGEVVQFKLPLLLGSTTLYL